MPGPALEGDGRVQFEVHERQNAFRQGIRSRNARGECDWGISGGYGSGNSAITIISKHLNSVWDIYLVENITELCITQPYRAETGRHAIGGKKSR